MKQDTLFARFLIKLQTCLLNEELLTGEPPNAALIIPAKNPEPGDIQVWDDVVELTISIGNMFHCHFDPTVFVDGNVSQEEAEQKALLPPHCLRVAFICIYSCYYANTPLRLCVEGIMFYLKIRLNTFT